MKKEIIEVDVTDMMEQLAKRFPRLKHEMLKSAIRAYLKEKVRNWDIDSAPGAPPGIRTMLKQIAGDSHVDYLPSDLSRDEVTTFDPTRLEMIVVEMQFELDQKSASARAFQAILEIDKRGERLTLESFGREMRLGHDENDSRAQGSNRLRKAKRFLKNHELKGMFDHAKVALKRNYKKKKG